MIQIWSDDMDGSGEWDTVAQFWSGTDGETTLVVGKKTRLTFTVKDLEIVIEALKKNIDKNK